MLNYCCFPLFPIKSRFKTKNFFDNFFCDFFIFGYGFLYFFLLDLHVCPLENHFGSGVKYFVEMWLEVSVIARDLVLASVLHHFVKFDHFFCGSSVAPEDSEAAEFEN